MVFKPSKTTGLIIGLAALFTLVGLAAIALPVVRTAPFSLRTLLALCVLAASLPIFAFISYRCYGLARGHYVLSRNALVVEWGWRRELIPAGAIRQVRAVTEPADLAKLRPHGFAWPGCLVGEADLPEWGMVEFLAAAGDRGLVVVDYGERSLALSPAAPQAFVQAFADFQTEGPSAVIEPESIVPGFQRWSLWRDRLALGLIAVGGASAIALWGYLLLAYPSLGTETGRPLNVPGQPSPLNLYVLPVIAGTAWAVNTLLGLGLRRRAAERPMAYMLFGATLFAQALVWAAAMGLATAGR